MSPFHTNYDWGLIVQIIRSEKFLLITQEELARRLEVCTSTVTKWEARKSVPKTSFRRKIRELAQNAGFHRENWPLIQKQKPYLVADSSNNLSDE